MRLTATLLARPQLLGQEPIINLLTGSVIPFIIWILGRIRHEDESRASPLYTYPVSAADSLLRSTEKGE